MDVLTLLALHYILLTNIPGYQDIRETGKYGCKIPLLQLDNRVILIQEFLC